jgi:hypothetical protein
MSLCPHCRQPLPDPPPRFCPFCGQDTTLAGEPILPEGAAGAVPPPPPLPPSGSVPPSLPPSGSAPPPPWGPPWERRQQIGFLGALVETTQQVLTGPSDFFRNMPVTGGLGGPLLYAVIVGTIGHVASALYSFILQATLGSAWHFGRHSELERYLPMVSSGAGLIGQILFGPIVLAIVLFFVAAIVHLGLLLLGGATNGFEATFRVATYSEAVGVIRIVPICGDLVAFIYYFVLLIIGTAEAHRTSGLKAAAAVLLPVLILCCCCGAGVAMFAGGIASLIGHMQ